MKQSFKEFWGEIKKLHIGRRIENYIKFIAHIFWAGVVIFCLYIAYQVTQTSGEIDGAIFEKNPETGRYTVGHFRTTKYAPEPPKRDNNMVTIGADYRGIRNYHYKRRLWSPFGMGIWGGLFVQEGQDQQRGNMFAAGVSLSISF